VRSLRFSKHRRKRALSVCDRPGKTGYNIAQNPQIRSKAVLFNPKPIFAPGSKSLILFHAADCALRLRPALAPALAPCALRPAPLVK